MTKRFRLVAGPNGSGKTTLKRRLEADYAVNFYDSVNADDIFAEVASTGAYAPRIAIDEDSLKAFAESSEYEAAIRGAYLDGSVGVAGECVRFAKSAINSYTVALLANYLQEEHIRQGASFSMETVFSHPSKISALAEAKAAGFRTYLYFVATDSPALNALRVAERAAGGGHDVPRDKIVARYARSLRQVEPALEYLDRAFFFDNSDSTMKYLASWNREDGFVANIAAGETPEWFGRFSPNFGVAATEEAGRLAESAAAASREAVARTFEAGRPIAVMRGGRLLRITAGGEEEEIVL